MPRNDNISAKLRHSSLLRQNTVKFGTDFTRARQKFTQALLARLYVFPSLAFSRPNVAYRLRSCCMLGEVGGQESPNSTLHTAYSLGPL